MRCRSARSSAPSQAGARASATSARGITPEILDDLGIQSFMHTESCYNYPNFPERMTPFEALYTDLERLGRIFGVEDRADAYVAELRGRVAAIQQAAPRLDPPPSVFLYDSATDRPFTAANQVPPNEIIQFAGARNIFGDLEWCRPSRRSSSSWTTRTSRPRRRSRSSSRSRRCSRSPRSATTASTSS
jgi:substrate-binding family protein